MDNDKKQVLYDSVENKQGRIEVGDTVAYCQKVGNRLSLGEVIEIKGTISRPGAKECISVKILTRVGRKIYRYPAYNELITV